MKQTEAVIVGGGPAGLAAAAELYRRGIRDMVILEREKQLGGILRQCIHDGFGLSRFKETLSGPEYAARFIRLVKEQQIPVVTEATVLRVTEDKRVYAASPEGMIELQAKAVVLAMGCRERTRGAISIPGERPAGVYTAGTAQAYMNLYNRMPGKEAVILGSGDIGMIMARRLTLEGAKVKAVFEVQPYASGLPRNIEQCLKDYGIPLYLSHTVTEVLGKNRLTGVRVSEVDENLRPLPGTEREIACDTLILSVGLIPENELSEGAGVAIDARTKGAVVDQYYQTSVPGIFAAGNVLHVHDLVDFVSLEAEELAAAAARYIREGELLACPIEILTDGNIGHTIPQRVSGRGKFTLSLRVRRPMGACTVRVSQGGRLIREKKMKKAVPAEMIQFPVDADGLDTGMPLEVSVVC